MSRVTYLYSTLFLLLAGIPAAVQEADSPASCLKAARVFVNERVKAVSAEGRKMTSDLYRTIQQEKARRAAECSSPFKLEGSSPEEALVLAELYSEAEQPARSAAAIEAALSAPGLGVDRMARQLVQAVTVTMRSPVSPEQVSRAEEYVSRLDGLPGAAARDRIEAHARLNGYYRTFDIDTKIIGHSTKIIQLGRQLKPEEQRALSNQLIGAYGNAAEAYASLEQPESALGILNGAPGDLPGIPDARKQLQLYVDRYSLVGRPAEPIEAPVWLNADPGTKSYEPKGAVTLVQFTAHWCGPCRKSYPAVKRIQERFAGRGFNVVMATHLYGYFQGKQDLSPAEETEADRGYFNEHLGKAVRVAIAGPATGPALNDARYHVGGIPQVHIIDKQGAHRLIMVGFDPSNEERVARFIERLLSEPGT